MWWSSSSGPIEIRLYKRHVSQGDHQGQCDRDRQALRHEPYSKKQLDTLKPAIVTMVLQEYGCWSEDRGELSDHRVNLERLVWLAYGDLLDAVP